MLVLLLKNQIWILEKLNRVEAKKQQRKGTQRKSLSGK